MIKRSALGLFGLALAAALIWGLTPQPVEADIGTVGRAPMRATVDDEGKTRIHDIYVIAAPIAGTLRRSLLKVGDSVVKNETTVAVIQPPPPEFRDFRTNLELRSQVKSCEANVKLAEAELRQASAEFLQAQLEYDRTKALTDKGVMPRTRLELAETSVRVREAAVTRAKAAVEVRQRELENAQNRLIGPEQPAIRQATTDACSFDAKSPESGRVLKLIAESEQAVTLGSPLLEIGDPANLEIVVDLLSAEAVKVREGAKATVEAWGGPALNAHVTRIEPSGFTKVSALGIEEQRVKTILAIDDPFEIWQRLGHDYRVFVKINAYESPNALVVPLGALFRRGDDWSTFVFENGKASTRAIKIGQRNASVAEVLEGLKEDERVILHPSDRIANGVRVRERIADALR